MDHLELIPFFLVQFFTQKLDELSLTVEEYYRARQIWSELCLIAYDLHESGMSSADKHFPDEFYEAIGRAALFHGLHAEPEGD